ncbi:MAG TPA: NUDIX hydrolase [Thermodesulfobacteriota bacterium]|nr:NUDIX hydrolase [Deltaproteobacteria bacterium]HNR14022.1 NUDIX hydrolase [Thermodesulfobacteriota bacterium]HNU70411.1 NUDIX hydrolase [Thermodesulfobacteriota bacterium]HOC38873.1 NUDIX hydrolase [Thermodesulfobacteriota bacterium]
MTNEKKRCPHCGGELKEYRNPAPTVDIIIQMAGQGIVLIKRKNPPYGWALPGGFIDYGETVEQAAQREALEETGLRVESLQQFHVYSDPGRDPRLHTISMVFTGKASGIPKAGDDAAELGIFAEGDLPVPLAFDHGRILADFFSWRQNICDQEKESPSKGKNTGGLT